MPTDPYHHHWLIHMNIVSRGAEKFHKYTPLVTSRTPSSIHSSSGKDGDGVLIEVTDERAYKILLSPDDLLRCIVAIKPELISQAAANSNVALADTMRKRLPELIKQLTIGAVEAALANP